ncbi:MULTISPECIES: alpha/beta fold hydrolase [Chryseobacterium]|uniref:Pimeloyl-ACP methyl ester carboxylesterase n=1 Tax=Chryseobacterium camelliae TaxID=1265445 RepID=A0ABU0TEM7_9FLAO|nr:MULTISPECIES: alpha/beta hydrolase [Chryseobacterium]MDT3406686.1 pimeloyl-ACP methyl ester carboxylesterase [Pseudacidovorax intermedius]MDQ1095516.1 pimeloyl-ACP methyl ester carboxylesterase [Chryseobacterium camelliae]MDQ1099453.1 pimeloyl-ACP methyl ester carboxylesterase [Chryseobacterium sp. SORGH_AS_1048]MDR6086799.1 pimeloyl-ACP methyl ester carboxylesterase [Chryseobacterium sp. SORGH_AS_0909]MDR6131172.1 pimeloyl-ACP methyl ester carboxylesterase [Chryseobacterium sp. SORGH_AS_11
MIRYCKLAVIRILLCSAPILASAQVRPLDAMLSDYQYPFQVEYINLNSQNNALKMAYMDVKPKTANGKTIMLLHGKNFNGAYWEKTAKDLSSKGFRVIIPDQIGFGKSSKPHSYQFSFAQLAENTKLILDQLNIDKVIVLGHSMGGMVATRFTLQYPEKVQKLILENPIGLEDYKTFAAYQNIDKAYQSELKNTAETYKDYQMKFYYDNRWKAEYQPWLDLIAGWTLHPDYPKVAWDAALTSDMIYNQPVCYEFKNIKVPTLLIIGTRDRTAIGKDRAPKELQAKMGQYQELGKKTQKEIPGSKLAELDNVGHLPHIEAYDRFWNALYDFIK